MRITSIQPAVKPRFPDRHMRAVMSVRNFGAGYVEHAVVDVISGQRVVLPAPEAWALHQSLNIEA